MTRTFDVTSSPCDAVAARDAAHEAAVLVGQRDAQAVDLELGDVRRARCPPARSSAAAEARVELAQLVLAVGVVEAEHRRQVRDRLEALGGPAADALGRRVGILQLGMRLLERRELAHQRVELGVGDLGSVVDVVPLFVVADQGAELGDAFGGSHGHRRSTILASACERRTRPARSTGRG